VPGRNPLALFCKHIGGPSALIQGFVFKLTTVLESAKRKKGLYATRPHG
jgi:hypothetical protein